MNRIILRTDGASRGNPGNSAIAFVIEGIGEENIEFGKKIGDTTNNQAEYQALVAGLERIYQETPRDSEIIVYSDSEFMVKQINGEYKVKNALIRPVYEMAKSLISDIEKNGNIISFEAIRRENNKRADELCNMALDNQL